MVVCPQRTSSVFGPESPGDAEAVAQTKGFARVDDVRIKISGGPGEAGEFWTAEPMVLVGRVFREIFAQEQAPIQGGIEDPLIGQA